jgi:uncharacterized SAM-binding protein YcdF (DUF218 family)
MLFVLAKIVSRLVEPGSILTILIVGGLVLSVLGLRRLGSWFLWIGAASLLAASVLPLDSWVIAPLENRFPSIHEMSGPVDGVIVLGGAIDPNLTALHGMPALGDSAERITGFVTLARRYPQAKLVFTGGSGSLGGGSPEADVAKDLLADIGLDTSQILFERESRDTYENVFFSRRLVAPKPGERWILVTSASHMPRAVGAFRHAGWPVIPWPVGYKSGISHLGSPALALENLDTATHEWIGLLAYRLLGRTDTLFPGP